MLEGAPAASDTAMAAAALLPGAASGAAACVWSPERPKSMLEAAAAASDAAMATAARSWSLWATADACLSSRMLPIPVLLELASPVQTLVDTSLSESMCMTSELTRLAVGGRSPVSVPLTPETADSLIIAEELALPPVLAAHCKTGSRCACCGC